MGAVNRSTEGGGAHGHHHSGKDLHQYVRVCYQFLFVPGFGLSWFDPGRVLVGGGEDGRHHNGKDPHHYVRGSGKSFVGLY
jgi:hypothetical protein